MIDEFILNVMVKNPEAMDKNKSKIRVVFFTGLYLLKLILEVSEY